MAASANVRLRLETVRLTALFNRNAAVREVSILFPAHTVTAIIGLSGCGKSTFLRCLNRMHELSEGGWVTGKVLLDEVDIYASDVNPIQLRRRIGMVFQRPTPFPTMSIFDNVAAGLRVNGRRPHHEMEEAVERALRQAALWDEVKDRLHASALELSGGQQKRLYTIVIVTHNLQQAARVSDYTAFFYMGRLIEVGRTHELFTKPQVEQTEQYITGRFG